MVTAGSYSTYVILPEETVEAFDEEDSQNYQVNTQAIKMCVKLQSSCLSDVDVRMSQVNVLLSEINQLISKCPVQFQSKLLLPRVYQILSEMTFIVSLSQSCVTETDEVDVDISLEWDHHTDYNNDYYSLYYNNSNNDSISCSSIFGDGDDDHEDVDNDRKGGGDHDDDDVEGVRDDNDNDDEGIRDDHDYVDGDDPDDDHDDVVGTYDDDTEEEENIADRVMSRRRPTAAPVLEESLSVLPTSSIFKQPVTVYKENKSKVKAEMKHVSGEIPLHLFSTKRLSSLNTVNVTEPDVDLSRRRITLPPSLNSATDVSSSTHNQANTFISKMLNFMSKIAPSSKYSKLRSDKRKRRKMMKYVHTELLSIWRNCEELFPRSAKSEVELSIYPQVDWSKVNSRMIKNVPAPFTYPVHGVSKDPEFYKIDEKKASEGYIPSKFHLSCPFGYKWGYETNCGVISTGCDQVLHGYAWSEDERRFILAAKFPNERKNSRKKVMAANSNKKPKRGEKLR